MQASNPTHQRGSFTKPDALTKSIDEHQSAKPSASKQPPEKVEEPVADESEKLVKARELSEDEKKQKYINDFKEMCAKEYGLSINEEELRNYLFKGILSKEIRINKLMSGTFQSLKTEDYQSIDKRMAKERDSGLYTASGLQNEEAIITLSYAWTHADGKPLGVSQDIREAKIRKMGSTFVQTASDARINFETLIKFLLHDGSNLKK